MPIDSKAVATTMNRKEATVKRWCRQFDIEYYIGGPQGEYILADNVVQELYRHLMVSAGERKARREQRVFDQKQQAKSAKMREVALKRHAKRKKEQEGSNGTNEDENKEKGKPTQATTKAGKAATPATPTQPVESSS